MKKAPKLQAVPKVEPRVDEEPVVETAPPAEPAKVAARYRIALFVEPADGGHGAQLRASDDRIEVGSFGSASELAWAMTEILEAVVKLFPEHHPAEIVAAPPVTKN